MIFMPITGIEHLYMIKSIPILKDNKTTVSWKILSLVKCKGLMFWKSPLVRVTGLNLLLKKRNLFLPQI